MAWDDAIPEGDYESALDRGERAFRDDVMRRAVAAGLDVNQFTSLHECDLYLQSKGR